MIKAAFFDIDGTLLSHTLHGVPAGTVRALAALRRRGVLVFAATGRHMQEFLRLPLHDLTFDGYVTLNGQLCLDRDGKILAETALPQADVQTLAALFAEKRLPLMLVEEKRMYINFVDEFVRAANRAISTPVPPTGLYTGAKLYQAILYAVDADVQPVAARLPGCKTSRWNRFGVDIVPKTGGKAAGIQRMLEHFGIRAEEIAAFGDGENDIEMLRYAGLGIAMGNAEQAVKEAADYVTDAIDSDGVARALAHFSLL